MRGRGGRGGLRPGEGQNARAEVWAGEGTAQGARAGAALVATASADGTVAIWALSWSQGGPKEVSKHQTQLMQQGRLVQNQLPFKVRCPKAVSMGSTPERGVQSLVAQGVGASVPAPRVAFSFKEIQRIPIGPRAAEAVALSTPPFRRGIPLLLAAGGLGQITCSSRAWVARDARARGGA